METDCYLDVNVPKSATADQIREFIRNGGIDGGDMMQDDSLFGGGWTWQETDMDLYFNPKASDISKSFLASLPEEDES